MSQEIESECLRDPHFIDFNGNQVELIRTMFIRLQDLEKRFEQKDIEFKNQKEIIQELKMKNEVLEKKITEYELIYKKIEKLSKSKKKHKKHRNGTRDNDSEEKENQHTEKVDAHPLRSNEFREIKLKEDKPKRKHKKHRHEKQEDLLAVENQPQKINIIAGVNTSLSLKEDIHVSPITSIKPNIVHSRSHSLQFILPAINDFKSGEFQKNEQSLEPKLPRLSGSKTQLHLVEKKHHPKPSHENVNLKKRKTVEPLNDQSLFSTLPSGSQRFDSDEEDVFSLKANQFPSRFIEKTVFDSKSPAVEEESYSYSDLS